MAASVPGVVALAVVPYLVYRLCPPDVTDTTAGADARRRSPAEKWDR